MHKALKADQPPADPQTRPAGMIQIRQVTEMGGQQEKTLQQGNQQAGNDHGRQDGDKLPQHPADMRQRQKGNHGGDNSRQHRQAHFGGTVHGRLQGRLAPLPVHIDGFPHHYGIIDDNTQHHNKPEQGDHIDGLPQGPENKEATGKRDRDSKASPEGEPQVQKDPEKEENQCHAEDTVTAEQSYPGFERPGVIIKIGQGNGRGQLLLLLRDIVFDLGGDFERILITGLKHHDKNRRNAVDQSGNRILNKVIFYVGNAVKGDQAALGIGQHNNVRQLFTGILPTDGAYPDLLPGGADGAAMEIKTGIANSTGHLGKTEAVLPQPFLGDLNGYLIGAAAENLDLGDTIQSLDLILDAVGLHLELFFPKFPAQGDHFHGVAKQDLGDDRPFRIHGKGGNGIYLGLDLVKHLGYVVPLLHLNRCRGHVFR